VNAAKSAPLSRPGILRVGLVLLGLPQLALGIWALISPSGWFGTFPGGGQHWLPAYGPFDEHLVTDVGATFLAIGLLLLIAGYLLERRVVQVALVAYLAYDIPHFIFHLGNDGVLGSGARVANGLTLGLSVASAAALLALTRRTTAPRTPRLAEPAGTGMRLGAPPGGPFTFVSRAYARRKYGGDVRPVDALAHHRKLAMGYGAHELALERSHRVPDRLKALGEMRAAAVAGCEWCMDFGSHLVRRQASLSDHELRELARYASSDAFSDLDKLVLDYATGMSRTPVDVGDELFERLRAELDDAQIVELTSAIAIENFRARFNHAVGIEPQGFSEGAACVIPDRQVAAA
jgi:4-carboxymuconolactone decarboxylase